MEYLENQTAEQSFQHTGNDTGDCRSQWINAEQHSSKGSHAEALHKAHNVKKIGTYVIKTLGRGALLDDIRGALHWVMDYHDRIDVYNIGYAGLRELRQDLTIVNEYFDRLEEGSDHV